MQKKPLITIIVLLLIFIIITYLVRSELKKIDTFLPINNRKLEIMLISLPKDEWKRERFEKSMVQKNQRFIYKIWEGVILREKPHLLNWAIKNKYTKIPKKPNAKGNIGSALAHITLWEEISKHDDSVSFLVFEDNVLATDKSWDGIKKVQHIDYDFINMRVLRPNGKKTQIPDLLKFESTIVTEPLPNVWLSSYLITPRGARLFLEELKKNQFDLSTDIIDRCVTIFLHSNDNIKAYIFDNDKYFGHIETSGDTRRKENG